VGDEQQQLGLQGHRDGGGRVHGLVVGFGAVDGLGAAPGQLVTVVTEQGQTCLGDGVLEVERVLLAMPRVDSAKVSCAKGPMGARICLYTRPSSPSVALFCRRAAGRAAGAAISVSRRPSPG